MNHFKSLHFLSSESRPLVVFLAIPIVLTFFSIVLQTLEVDTYPLYSDEYGYTKNVENLLENGSYASALTLDEKYSKIGGFSFHGFSYTAIYGNLADLFHVHKIIIINILLGISTLLFILFVDQLGIFNRIRLIVLTISYPVFFLYTFSYMVESIHFLLSIIITYMVYKILLQKQESLTWALVILVLLASLLRQTWFIFLFSLFFQSDLKKKLTYTTIIWFVSLLFVAGSMVLFNAPYENGFIYRLGHHSQNFSEIVLTFYGHFIQNVKYYFSTYNNGFYYFAKIGLICLLLCAGYYGIKEKNRFLSAISFIGWIYFFALLLLYDAAAWRELRVLSVVYLSVLFALSISKKDLILNIFLLLQILFFPKMIEYFHDGRTIFYQQPITKIEKQKLDAYSKLSSLDNPIGKNSILVAIDRGLFSLNYNRVLADLPLKTKKGVPIRYSICYFSKFDDKNTHADYLLTQHTYTGYKLVMQNTFFKLYRIEDLR